MNKLLILGFCFLIGCYAEPEKQLEYSTVKVELGNVRKERNIKIENIIPLETSAVSVIGRCEKIITHQGKYYVLDFKERNIKVFSKAGAYIETIGRIGRGNHEYLHISDININKSRNSLDAIDPRGKIVRYDLSSSSYLGDIVIPSKASELSHFTWLNNDTIILASFFQDFNIRMYSPESNIIFDKMVRSSMVDTEVAPFFFKSSFWKHKDRINYLNIFDTEVYCFNNGELKKRFALNFTSSHFSYDEIGEVKKEYDILEYLRERQKAFPIYNCYENEEYFAFGIYINALQQVEYFAFEKSSPSEIFRINFGKYPNNAADYEGFATGLESDHFIALVHSPDKIGKIFQGAIIPDKFEGLIDNALPEDNPFLIEYTIF